jgi:hypothetical protein
MAEKGKKTTIQKEKSDAVIMTELGTREKFNQSLISAVMQSR